jgi:hypothetical protein
VPLLLEDTAPIFLTLGQDKIVSKSEFSIVSITFNAKILWSNHASSATHKANRALMQ